MTRHRRDFTDDEIDFAALCRAADSNEPLTDAEATRRFWAPHDERVRAEREARWADEERK